MTMEEAFEQFFSADALAEMLGVVFGLQKGARILHFGSASGRMVGALRRLGYDAVGIEWDKALHAATPNEIVDNNLCGEPTDLPFATQAFDVVIESGYLGWRRRRFRTRSKKCGGSPGRHVPWLGDD